MLPSAQALSLTRGQAFWLAGALALPACSPPTTTPATVVVLAPGPRAASSSPATPLRPRPDARIRQVSVGVYEVEAPLFDELLAHPSAAAPHVRLEPVSEEGQFIGHRVTGIAPGSVLARLGLDDDDILELVNGESGRSSDSLAAARLAAQRTAQVTVVLRRHGFQKLMIYRLVYY